MGTKITKSIGPKIMAIKTHNQLDLKNVGAKT
jgi:hypothetical protein